MRGMILAGWIGLIGIIGTSGYATGQDTGGTTQTQPPLATGGLLSSLLAAPVPGEPYSAVLEHSTSRNLPDGSTVFHHGHHAVARDAEGRVHVEVRMANGQNGAPDEAMVFVMDPVAHTLTTWLSGGSGHPKVATSIKLPQHATAPPPRPEDPQEKTRPQPIITTEDLGKQSIQGLEVTGKRVTTIVPVGRAGNSAPITKTHEVWTSPELQLVIKQQWDDPRSGRRTVELEHVSRANPNPDLFRAPADYEVKDAVQTLKDLEEKLGAMEN